MRILRPVLVLAVMLILSYSPSSAQAIEQDPIEVGAMAPDFELPGATRYGVLDDLVTLSDYRGDAIILAFFFRARTRG